MSFDPLHRHLKGDIINHCNLNKIIENREIAVLANNNVETGIINWTYRQENNKGNRINERVSRVMYENFIIMHESNQRFEAQAIFV